MYTPPGFGVSELGDIEIVADGDELHCFHLTLPNHDLVQHAISQDGLTWRPLPAALRTGDPGEVDDDQIWTVSVTRTPDGSGFVMLYTALATAEQGRVQRVAIAESNDLRTWTKRWDLPVISADPRWYEHEPGTSGAVSWRDPKPVRVGNGYVATICARTNEGPLPRRGCAALMASSDLHYWEVLPPLHAPHRYWDLECPQLFSIAQQGHTRWYLVAAIMEDRSLRYWMADSPSGPFHVPRAGDRLAPAGHYAARVARWQDEDLLFAWHQPTLQQGWQSTPASVNWVEARNPFGKFLAPPLRILPRPDGSLALASFSGWDAYRLGPWRPLLPADAEASWRLHRDGIMSVLPAAPVAEDVAISGVLRLDAARGGVAMRLDDHGSGLYIELTPGSREVTLQRWDTRPRDLGASTTYRYSELQRATLATPVPADSDIPVHLLCVGPYIEFSLHNEVALAFMTGEPATGNFAIWADDGSCLGRDLRWAAMRRPETIAPRT